MFSGIVEATGVIREATPQKEGVRFTIAAPRFAGDLKAGESVCVSGACLTVVASAPETFAVDLVPETLSRTSFGGLGPGSKVNLERSLRLADRLGGHLVSGHVDGVGRVVSRVAEGQGIRLGIEAPPELRRYLVCKGSVCVEGVSLTVAAVGGAGFEVALIPYTLDHTNLSGLKEGSPVNLESDLIAKYVERLLDEREAGLFVRRAISLEDLGRMGVDG
jgi:riboflavin synthase